MYLIIVHSAKMLQTCLPQDRYSEKINQIKGESCFC